MILYEVFGEGVRGLRGALGIPNRVGNDLDVL